jgi:hypothetical protein
MRPHEAISYLKKVFSPAIGVEPSSQILAILAYACGHPPLKNKSDGKSRSAGCLGLALISSENLNFEMASNEPERPSAGIGLVGWPAQGVSIAATMEGYAVDR